jgi:hypothetical protein
MKRLIILVSLIALLASGMVFAQVTVSGQIEYGVLTDFDNPAGQHWDNQLRFDAKVDEFNTGVVRFRIREGGVPDATEGIRKSDAPLIDRAYVQTNVLGALGVKGVPVKWISTNGFNWTQTLEPTAGVSPYAVSRVSRIATGGGKQAALHNKFTFADMLNLSVAVFPGDFSAGAGGYFLAADTTVPAGPGKLTAELNMGTTGGAAFDKSDLTGGAKYLMPMGDMNLGFVGNFLMALDSDKAVGYKYGVAASVAIPMVGVKAGLLGYEESEVNAAEFQLMLTPSKLFAIEVGGVMGLDSDVWEETLNELDVNLQIKAGKNLMRIGYLLVSEDNGKGSLLNNELSRVGRTSKSYVEKGGLYFEVSCPY